MRCSCALLTALLLAGCNRDQALHPLVVSVTPASDVAQPIAIAGEVVGDFVIGEPVRYAKLTVFPISSRVAKTSDRFLTLDEGLASGKVEIREVGGASDPAEEEVVIEETADAVPTANEPSAVHAIVQPNVLNPLETDCGDEGPADPFGAAPAVDAPADAPVADDPFGGDAPAADAPVADAPVADDPFGGDTPEVVPPKDAPADAAADDDPFATDTPAVAAPVVAVPATEVPVADDPFAGEPDEVEGDVNRLMFVNSSDRPLYLMPGELIVGGKQDRTIARETIVPPSGKPVEVEVFCVEHGRWNTRSPEELRETIVAAYGGNARDGDLAVSVAPDFSTERTANPGTVDLKSRGKFVASLGAISSVARRTVQEASEQSKVWERVALENQRAGTNSDSGAFTANYLDPEIVEAIGPYMKELGTSVADRPQVVGVLVAVGNEIRTVDVFESTPLFQKMWPKLLKSFAFDALDAEEVVSEEQSEQDKAEAVPVQEKVPTLADARRCLELATQSKVQEIKTEDGLTMTRREVDEMVSFSVHDEESYRSYGAAGGGMGGGGFGGAVHGGGFY